MDFQKLKNLVAEASISDDYNVVTDNSRAVASAGLEYDAARTLLDVAKRWPNTEGRHLFIDQAVSYGARLEAVATWEEIREKHERPTEQDKFFYDTRISEIMNLM